jgi:hypothetical protein
MPTVLYFYGWRFFFYSNEGNEPIHIHAEKGDMECKFWINELELTIKLANAFNMASDKINEVAEIIYDNLQLIINAWHNYFKS